MILQNGKTVRLISGSLVSLKTLPSKNFLVKKDPQSGELYLEEQEDFKLPKKIYGDVDNLVDRYLNTFKNRDKNLGILLKGLKGTGKSLLAKAICIASNMPVIIVTEPWQGSEFEDFLSNIKQEVVIFLDEFEKTYSNEKGDGSKQNGLLSILDGVFEGKKLFLLTCNNDLAINNALINRPGRIHYFKEYKGLEDSVIDSIINDLLIDKSHIKSLKKACFQIGDVNMDSLITIINEMNMYKESPKEVLEHLNIRPETASFEVRFIVKNVSLIPKNREDRHLEKIQDIEFYCELTENPLATDYLYTYANPSVKNEIDYNIYRGIGNWEINENIEDCIVELVSDNEMKITSKDTGIVYNIKKSSKIGRYSLIL